MQRFMIGVEHLRQRAGLHCLPSRRPFGEHQALQEDQGPGEVECLGLRTRPADGMGGGPIMSTAAGVKPGCRGQALSLISWMVRAEL